MDPSRGITWQAGAIALAFLLGSCNDFSQHRFGGVRKAPEEIVVEPSSRPPALYIPSAPSVARADFTQSDTGVKQAKFVPPREPPPQADPNPAMPKHPLRALYERAAQRHAGMDSYIFRLKRRESVGGKKQPEELMQVKLRREPFSVYLKWLNADCKGRETIYVRGKYDNKMQLVLAANDAFPFSPAGLRWSIAPDDPMARAKSRHPITETGFDSLIESYGRIVAAMDKGDPREGTAKYLGRLKRPEFEAEVETVHQVLPANSDPQLPKGGQRWWYFDAATGLPALIIAHDPGGEVEYYCYDHVQYPVQLDDDDFNPDRLWRR